MKEIRLNDKMWFGKYSGYSIKDIMDRDMLYVDKLISGSKFKINDNIFKYIEKRNEERRKSRWGEDDRPSRSFYYQPTNWNEEIVVIEGNEPPPPPRDSDQQRLEEIWGLQDDVPIPTPEEIVEPVNNENQ